MRLLLAFSSAGQGFFVLLCFFLLCKAFLPLFSVSLPFTALNIVCASVSHVGLVFILVPVIFGSEDEYHVYISFSLLSCNTEVIEK